MKSQANNMSLKMLFGLLNLPSLNSERNDNVLKSLATNTLEIADKLIPKARVKPKEMLNQLTNDLLSTERLFNTIIVEEEDNPAQMYHKLVALSEGIDHINEISTIMKNEYSLSR